MSYAKVKTITINERENKITVTSAENNIRPLIYSKWELGKTGSTFKEKMYSLFESLIYRDLQLQNSCNKKIINATNKILNEIMEIKDNSEYDYFHQFTEAMKQELFEKWIAAMDEKVSNDQYIISLWNNNIYLKISMIRCFLAAILP